MKMRKKLAALLAAAMIASVMPMTAFAASTNRVTHTVKVKEEIKSNYPQLKIELKDTLKEGEYFYLTLENAKWNKTEMSTTSALYTYGEKTDTRLQVLAKKNISAGEIIVVDLKAKDIKGEAAVTVEPYDTVVSAGKYVFATSDSTKAKAKVADPETFADRGKVAKITFEEPYIGAFENTKAKQYVTIELNDKNFYFTKNDDAKYGELKGSGAFAGVSFEAEYVSAQKLRFEITNELNGAAQRGLLELVDLRVEAKSKAIEGDVEAYIDGYFFQDETVVVAKYGDYTTKLTTKEVKEFKAGKKETVKFTLEEVAKDAIQTNRATTFTLSKDIEVLKVKVNGNEITGVVDADDKNVFVIDAFTGTAALDGKKAALEVEVNIPAKFKGDLSVKAEGRSIEEAKEVQLAEVAAPVTVEVEAMKVEVGTKSNKGGKITIKETDKKNINRGMLVIQLDKDLIDDGVEFTKVKDLVLNTTGGIKVEEAKYNATTSAIEIEVTRQSSEVGSIEISGFEVKARRTIADGAYEIKVGGSAISSIANLTVNAKDEYTKLDAIQSNDFLLVGNVYGRAEVVFNINSDKFTVNGKEITMDAAAYIKDGRTMVPLRYLSVALGIDEESIKFNSGIVTIFAADGKVIQVQNGNKNLAINGMTIPMVAAAEIIEGRTYVPVTEIGGVFGVAGTWDAASQTATFK